MQAGSQQDFGLQVVDPSTVQNEHGLALTVLDAMHRDITNSAFHAATPIWSALIFTGSSMLPLR